ncbi:sigma-70 family RNA polymerase sigma factor [Metapseudomonas lalkuanensis]|uniref:Sigma-70 family RNA polymerase sigma factor n=1 Tax=Metapseudomonas lalkuanensis TaxID=2604832 RepID=A0A5J6QN44_9GAMM|nr:RNA polymerase sigma factor SigJ [Pseudomonas lalkuanensis]QEY64198.1 sigma-70 family RNA polymerase sigma factor [Pseudomonas lalkuanensis]UCO96815.1 RNA polymerase sigma factor SigJ [Pseudomonas lalkuanensis]
MRVTDATAVFEDSRRFLLNLAYRILGSRSDAEDAVQETFLKWRESDSVTLDNPRAWLTTLCTRHCIDQLRLGHRARVDYVGTWLPEPIHSETTESPEMMLELSSSLSTAFLLLLERLTPRERAAYLLHDIFDLDYPDVARAIGVQEAACRKLVSRARISLAEGKVRHQPPAERQEQLLEAFHAAIASGATAGLTALLSEEVELSADGGGKVPTLGHILRGKAEVLAFIVDSLRGYWSDYRWLPAELNGGHGVILAHGDQAAASVTFAYDDEGRASNIYIVRNPEKLAGLTLPN